MIKLTIQNLYFKKAENQLLKMEGTPMVEMEGVQPSWYFVFS